MADASGKIADSVAGRPIVPEKSVVRRLFTPIFSGIKGLGIADTLTQIGERLHQVVVQSFGLAL